MLMRINNTPRERAGAGAKAQIVIQAVILIVMILAGAVYFIVNTQRKITLEGNNAAIDFKGNSIKALMGHKGSFSFLVNNAFSNAVSVPSFFVIPMETAKSLKRQYGDFVHCNSPGAQAGMESLETLCLIPLNKTVERKIRNVMKEKYNLPVIEITGCKLEIMKHKYFSKRHFSHAPGGETYYLIEDVNITQLHYQ
jgi:hypothetical protein